MLESTRDRMNFMTAGAAPFRARNRITTIWYERMKEFLDVEKERHYSATNGTQETDSRLGNVRNIYKSWSCTDDISILDRMSNYNEYKIPEGSLPPGTASIAMPPDLYKWFGAEIRSPIMDYDNPRSHETLRTVCKTLRDTLRIHKPMAGISTGLHVHIGQPAGWTLLHLKKFATLWHLLEPSLYKLHRRDREQNLWCVPVGQNCNLARYVFFQELRYDQYAATTTGPPRKAYERQMVSHLPQIDSPRLEEYFVNIWQYQTINDLRDAMNGATGLESGMRWQVSGDKLSLRPDGPSKIQTLELRMMQGTMDADHIWRWASLLERVVVFARDSSPLDFKLAIDSLRKNILSDRLGFNQDDLEWFRARRTDNDYFAYPDPDGMVNWKDPFCAPGYGDTHGLSA
jgi:hypothetical protein